MVGYVLLIVIAMGLATLVFVFLKAYVPKEKPECKDGVNIIIESAQCTHTAKENDLTITLRNKGLFLIDKAYLTIRKKDRNIGVDIPGQNPVQLLNEKGSTGLNPDESTNPLTYSLPSAYGDIGDYTLEIQPALYVKVKNRDELAICPPINQQVTCS